ncbi:hypothetical protein LTR97_001923 [Elasticomyces elasticus]|uniref:DEAD/DEAH-box helicase domain-containing protein n=1 Tax=Elasticomyces elasticus TaxID=574655 RepID=A0AAN8A5B3_9PEZI|nr:hypothetical protein LTR97_001923 [Elasticomyces elasticus]
MRAIVVHRASLSRQQAVQRAIDDGDGEEEAQANAPSVGERLLIDNVSFSIDDIRSVVHGLVETVQQALARNLLMIEPAGHDWKPASLPAFSMEKLFNNAAELSAGWSFLRDARTEWVVDGERWMRSRLFHDAAIQKRFVKRSGKEVSSHKDVKWNEAGIERYFRAVQRWKEQLIVLVYLSAGAPARATEFLSVQHQNGAEARAQRGIFIENQMMAIVTTYHKGYSASGKFKTVHRFVLDEVAEVVVYFLWLVQPFIEHLQSVSGQHTDAPTSFLWEPEAEEGWEAGEDEEMDEELQGEEPSVDEGDEEGFEPPRPEAVSTNVDGFWDTNRMRRVMQRETEKRIGIKIGVALWRQAYPAIQRQYSVDANVRGTIDQLYEQVIGPKSGTQSIEEVRAKQAGHGLHIEEMIYGLLLNESPFTTTHEREQFRQVSMNWHRMLHFRSAWRDDGRMPKQVKQQVEAAREEARRWRYKQMRSVDIDVQLKRVAQNEQAEFRGVQRKGLRAVVGCMPRVTIVMRTGGGKSLFFMIPAAGSKDGVTIVVVPVVSLRQDLVDRCERVGLSVAA